MSILKENSDWHVYYDYLSEYDEREVLMMLMNGENLWSPLIKASMYQQALNEFIKFGKFVKFPTNYVFQWMGTIMKNTAIIRAITSIAGHDIGFPAYAVKDVFFNDDDEAWEKYKQSLAHKGTFSPDFGWMDNEEEGGETHEVDDEEAAGQFLEDNGYYDKMTLPDGSRAWSDFGIRPLEEIIGEYYEGLSAEETITLVNRALDVTHQNGDLASAFIEGGSRTLTSISNRGYLNESVKVYHGSPCKEIVTGKFKKGKTGYLGPGIYFSEDKDYTRRYAKKYGEGAIYEVEINLLNPLVLKGDNPTKDFLTTIYRTESVYLRRSAKQSNICYLIESKDVKKFLSMGYDGVIWDFAGNKEYVVYDNTNIKIIGKEEVLEENKMDNTKENSYKEYTEYLKDMFELIKSKFGVDAPYPKVVFHTKKQECEPILIRTGYFDPNTKKIHLFLYDDNRERAVKDVARSFCHECIHYMQGIKGVIDKSGYTGDKITEDNKLVKLEAEAYLKGNMYFREFTEKLQKKG